MPVIKQIKIKNKTTGGFTSFDIGVDSDNVNYDSQISFKDKIDAVARKIDERNYYVSVDGTSLQFYDETNPDAITGDIVYETTYDTNNKKVIFS